MRFFSKWLLVLTLLSPFCNAWCQQITFNRLGVEEGLSQNSVLAIAQDKQGFVWLGTRAGLNRYDSYRFSVYKTNTQANSLSSAYITSILCDSKGRLWVGTSNGLNLYNTQNDNFLRIKLNTGIPKTENQNRINSIYEDKRGRIWVASEYDLHLITTPTKLKIQTVPLLFKHFPLRSLMHDHEGVLWIGTTNGIYQLKEHAKGFHVKNLSLKAYGLVDLANVHILSIIEDKHKNIWLGTGGKGLIELDTKAGKINRYTNTGTNAGPADNNIRRLLPDEKGNIWVGTQNGLSILDVDKKQFTSYRNDPWNENSLSQNSIHSLCKSNDGTIWIGTFFGGVNRCFSYATPFETISNKSARNALNNNVISSIIEDEEGALWIGTEGGGVNYINTRSGINHYYLSEPNNKTSLGSNLVKTIYRDKQNNIWIGTHAGGLNLFNRKTNTFTRFLQDNNMTLGSEITCILKDHQNRLWIGTETAGLNIFEKRGNGLKNIAVVPTESKSIISLIETSKQHFWAGTRQGLYIIDANTRKYIKKDKNGLPLIANCLLEDTGGFIWVGTNDSGIYKYDNTGRLMEMYTTSSGLADNKVLGILKYNNDLWISTANGLSRFDSIHKTFINYNEADGLPGNAFNNNAYYKSASGKMYFGGFKGVLHFAPGQIRINHTTPAIRITSLTLANYTHQTASFDSIFRQRIADAQPVTLNYNQNIFELNFAVLSYIKSEKNKYQYYLSGYDKGWQNTNAASVNYTNVPPGSYTFYVRGSNNDNFGSNPAALQITVLPPFWKTWWAYIIYACIVSGIIALIIRYFVLQALYVKNKEITTFKLNFFTNISHEIRTHLSLIIGPTERLLANKISDPVNKQQLLTIKNNSESLLQLVNELMDFRKAEEGRLLLHVSCYDIVSFLQSVRTTFYDFSISTNIALELTSSTKQIKLFFDKEQLQKVFYNLIYNAFKFSGNGSQVEIRVDEAADSVDIKITNYGIGISPAGINRIFEQYYQENVHKPQSGGQGIGLALSKSIVELHGGLLKVESEFEKPDNTNKTTFIVTLYKGKRHLSNVNFVTDDELFNIVGSDHTYSGDEHQVETNQTATQTVTEYKPVILIVEDNDAIRDFLKQALVEHYEVLETQNGAEGLAVAVSAIPDIIITDVMMPEMDGLAFCKHIKSDERTSHIPLIILTAKNGVQHHVEGLRQGADSYLTKPFSIQVLLLQIKNLLNARAALWLQLSKGDGTFSEKILKSETSALHPVDEAFLKKIISFIEDNLNKQGFGVGMLSKMVGMSQPVLFKKIKAITGFSANDFIKNIKLKKAAALLKENRYTVAEIAFLVGYESSKYFSREFKKHYNLNPSEYKHKQEEKI